MSGNFQAIVLAGGLGTRLRSVLGEVPKVLAPIRGQPWLIWVLRGLRMAGFSRVCLAIGHAGAEVKGAVAVAQLDDLAITYSDEAEPLGTGGALRRAANTMPNAPTFVLNGDTWLRVPWSAMLQDFRASGCDISVALRRVPDRARYGAVEVDSGRIVAFGEKSARGPGLINAGVYLLVPNTLHTLDLPEKFSFETAVLQQKVGFLSLRGYPVDGAFIDIGVPEDLRRADNFVNAHFGHDR